MSIKSKNEIIIESTTNGKKTKNIVFSKKSYELFLKHGESLKSFSSKEKAEEFFFSLKDYLIKELESLCLKYNLFNMDYTIESIKNIEKVYFDLYEKSEFKKIGISREEFEDALGIYWGECAIRYDSLRHWVVEENWLVHGKYELYLEDRFGNKISYKYFDNLFKYPDNKTHKRMFREFKKMVMD